LLRDTATSLLLAEPVRGLSALARAIRRAAPHRHFNAPVAVLALHFAVPSFAAASMVVDVAHRHKSACYDSPPPTCIGAMEGCAAQRLSAPMTPKLLGTSAHCFKEKSYPKHAKPQVRAVFPTLQIRTANPTNPYCKPFSRNFRPVPNRRR